VASLAAISCDVSNAPIVRASAVERLASLGGDVSTAQQAS
jgi:hypothetical protein